MTDSELQGVALDAILSDERVFADARVACYEGYPESVAAAKLEISMSFDARWVAETAGPLAMALLRGPWERLDWIDLVRSVRLHMVQSSTWN